MSDTRPEEPARTVGEAVAFFRHWLGTGRIGAAGNLLADEVDRLTAAVRAALDVFDAPSAHYSTDPDVRAALDAMRDEERDAAAALRRALDGEG